MTENQRLKIIQGGLGFKTQVSFARALKLTSGGLSDILREKGGLGVSGTIKRILENSYNVNIDWLENGVGDMFKPGNDNISAKTNFNEPGANYRVIKMIEPENNTHTSLDKYLSDGYEPIPVYDNTSGISLISELLNNDHIKPVVLIMKGHVGCNLVVRHNDRAMDKVFAPKSQLGIQIVNNFKKMIVPGMAAIIVLEDFTITRYVHNAPDDSQLVFKSADPDAYPDITISKEDIREMWKIKSCTPEAVSQIMMY